MPAGSPRAITRCGLASELVWGDIPLLRLFLLGLVLVGLASGLQRQWLVIDWNRILTDLGLTESEAGQPIDFHQLIIGEPAAD